MEEVAGAAQPPEALGGHVRRQRGERPTHRLHCPGRAWGMGTTTGTWERMSRLWPGCVQESPNSRLSQTIPTPPPPPPPGSKAAAESWGGQRGRPASHVIHPGRLQGGRFGPKSLERAMTTLAHLHQGARRVEQTDRPPPEGVPQAGDRRLLTRGVQRYGEMDAPRCPAATVMGPWDRYCSAGTRCTCDLRRQTGGGKQRGGLQRNEMEGNGPRGAGGLPTGRVDPPPSSSWSSSSPKR